MTRCPLRRGWRRIAHLFALSAACIAAPAAAQGVAEYALKATLLFKLPQFVYWQAPARAPEFRLCVIGANPFGDALEKLARNPIAERPVQIVRLGGGASADCELLFVARSEAASVDTILKRLGRPSTLTVSDIDGFARAGGMIELAVGAEGSAISLIINRRTANRQSIEFNAQLLRLARVVDP